MAVSAELLTLLGIDTSNGKDEVLFGDDFLLGAIAGGAGNDYVEGKGGLDLLTGGRGTDTVGYSESDVGVHINLGNLLLGLLGAYGGDADGDLLVNGFENVVGSAHADDISGDGGANVLVGLEDADRLDGSGGDDTLIGGNGADALIGDAGSDTASYALANAGVAVSLSTGTGTAGEASGDTLTGIENLTGSAFADVLEGNAGDNIIETGAGDDVVIGTDGLDVIDGGTGNDTLDFSANTTGVTLDFGSGNYISIEGIVGGSGGDTINLAAPPAAEAAVLAAADDEDEDDGASADGGDGDDSITGSEDDDEIEGGAGEDVLMGGSDPAPSGAAVLAADTEGDTLGGGDGDDQIYGGKHFEEKGEVGRSGYDHISAGKGNDTVYGGNSYDAGSDVYFNSGHNKIDAGEGNDKVYAGCYSKPDDKNYTEVGENVANGGDGNDQLHGASKFTGTSILTAAVAETGDTLNGDAGDDMITGGNRDDTIDGGADHDEIDGGAGNDKIVYSDGADDVSGGDGDDVYDIEDLGFDDAASQAGPFAATPINGGSYHAGSGHDVLHASGYDANGKELRIEPSSAPTEAAFSDDGFGPAATLANPKASLLIKALDGQSWKMDLDSDAWGTGAAQGTRAAAEAPASSITLVATAGDDAIVNETDLSWILDGGNGNDHITGGGGHETLKGEGGNDTFVYSAGADVVEGGDGDDTYEFENWEDEAGAVVDGGEFDPGSGHNVIRFLDEATYRIAYLPDATDASDGGSSDADSATLSDKIKIGINGFGRIGRLVARVALQGDDVEIPQGVHPTAASSSSIELEGSDQGDVIENLTDTSWILDGADGNDTITGGTSSEIIIGGRGADAIDGGDGDPDTADYSESDAGVTISLPDGVASGGHAEGDTLTDIEWLNGSAFNDSLTGGPVKNTLTGGGGDDLLRGGGGDDTLNGGEGVDTLTGGAGADVFRYTGVADSPPAARDRITDFTRAQGDKIDLSAIDADANQAGDQAFSFIGSAQFSGQAGELRAVVDNSVAGFNTRIPADVNGDGTADLAVMVNVAGGVALAAGDFVL